MLRSTTRKLRITALGLAVIFVSATGAGAFQLEPKGSAAKWRSDIIKKQNSATACLLKAWNTCEKAATSANAAIAPAGPGSGGRDCDITAGTLTSVNSPNVPAAAITAFNTAVTNCLKATSDTSAKKGFSSKRYTDTVNPTAVNLQDIGCIGDCSTADGSQPCADVEAYETAYTNPLNNALKTAAQISDTANATIALLIAGCDAVDVIQSVKKGTNVNNLASLVITYTGSVSSCVQKCQDDLTGKQGGGFFDDTTACYVLPKSGTAYPYGLTLSTTNLFTTCLAKAYDVAYKAQKLTSTKPICNGPVGTNNFTPLVDAAINNSNNSSFDRLDLSTSALLALTTSTASPFFSPANASLIGATLADRAAGAARRTTFGGTCASCGNGLLEDYEECDGTNTALCGALPGTLPTALCPAADDASTSPPSAACRCPRP